MVQPARGSQPPQEVRLEAHVGGSGPVGADGKGAADRAPVLRFTGASTPKGPGAGAFLLRPGSLERSTSLWWLIPILAVWSATAVLIGVLSWRWSSVLTLTTSLRILLVGSSFTTAWGLAVVLTQRESDTESGPETIDVRGRHAYWRARTVAWDLTALGIAGTGLVLLLLAGPNRVLPSVDVPLVELAVLTLTLALLATFSRYAAMAFSTDAKGVVQELEQVATAEATSRESQREELKVTIHQEIERLISKVSEQITATQTGLSQITVALQGVASAIEQQTRVGEGARRAAEAAAQASDQRLVELRAAEAQRLEAVRLAAEARRRRISPALEVAVRLQGTVLHSVWIDVRNRGFDGRGLELRVHFSTGGVVRFRAAGLASMTETTFSLGDVGRIPLVVDLRIEGSISDVDGERRGFEATPIRYGRRTGLFGVTRAIGVHPAGWIPAPEVQHVPVALNAPSAD